MSAPQAAPAPRRVTILGATGSVGRNTLDLIERERARFEVVALTAHRDVDTLIAQARRLRPDLAVIADPVHYAALRAGLAGTGIEAAAGPQAVIEAAARPAEWVMAAIVGAAGLEPTLAAVRRGAVVALANKECLVCAGAIFLDEVRRAGATLLPVDSEHNAIFQVFDFAQPQAVEKIVLTASGGPFRTRSLAEMAMVTPAQAVAHPTWQMGRKISVDSATMMNKGLELIEAFHLFPVGAERIEILVHPQSVVHSLVAYVDGSVLAQLGSPDMRTPIAVTLAWPERLAVPARRLDLAAIGQLTFMAPDPERFPALRLARHALQTGRLAPTILNAANEVAVQSFLDGQIGFLAIAAVVEDVLSRCDSQISGESPSLDAVRAADRMARAVAAEIAARRAR
jgi:1-deoxy-D-xylulose-5-phosphate reductoisomerase